MRLIDSVEIYIARKKSLGARYRGPSYGLRSFSKKLGDLQLGQVTTTDVKRFIESGGASATTRHIKHQLLRLFYEFWQARGEVSSSPLPAVAPKRSEDFIPHIYTRSEIQHLLDATPLSQEKGWCAMTAQTFRTMLLFLYGTGLRLGEALRLEWGHVDLPGGVVRIEQTKFYKSRLVPVGTDVGQLLSRHRESRKQDSACLSVFHTKWNDPVEMRTVDLSFHRLRQHAGVTRRDTSMCQPRIHDLRHSFAVHRLISWYRQGKDLHRLLPALSTYLGHADLSATQRYLTMTPELLQVASERFEQYSFTGRIHGR